MLYNTIMRVIDDWSCCTLATVRDDELPERERQFFADFMVRDVTVIVRCIAVSAEWMTMRKLKIYVFMFVVVVVLPVLSAEVGIGPDDEDWLSRPTEHGLRETPEMVRGVTRMVVKRIIEPRYQLDASKVDELTEMLARRLMKLMHELDSAEMQARKERVAASLLEAMVANPDEPVFHRFMLLGPKPSTAESAKTYSEEMLPLLPALRATVLEVAQDIRPLLPMKQQLKLATDFMTLAVGFNAYQDCLRDWSEGRFNPLVNPFMSEEMDPARDANGESETLLNARLNADFAANLGGDRAEDPRWKGNFGGWKNYVEEAKVFYQLDKSQSATADSVLREFVQRAKTLVGAQKLGDRPSNRLDSHDTMGVVV